MKNKLIILIAFIVLASCSTSYEGMEKKWIEKNETEKKAHIRYLFDEYDVDYDVALKSWIPRQFKNSNSVKLDLQVVKNNYKIADIKKGILKTNYKGIAKNDYGAESPFNIHIWFKIEGKNLYIETFEIN